MTIIEAQTLLRSIIPSDFDICYGKPGLVIYQDGTTGEVFEDEVLKSVTVKTKSDIPILINVNDIEVSLIEIPQAKTVEGKIVFKNKTKDKIKILLSDPELMTKIADYLV